MPIRFIPLISNIITSAQASASFALNCLEPIGENLRAKSSFVTPEGEIMHWHEFGDLEGPGWAANAVGGAHLLHSWGIYVQDKAIQSQALKLLDHFLKDGFIDWESGFIQPYYDLGQGRFCLNYTHKNDWLCPGSLARIGVQLLEFADDLPAEDLRSPTIRQAAANLGDWLRQHVPLLPNGWIPRRITLDGQPYAFTPYGRTDPIFDHSADGLFLLDLYAMLAKQGLEDYAAPAIALGEAFVKHGGFWGSINHDTYDDHECVAYAVAFRVLRRAAECLHQTQWKEFAYEHALPGLAPFQMPENRHGVATAGLLWMEASWNTAYLWENAEAALAYLEAWNESKNENYLQKALAILQAIALHHHGTLGFLTEGVDWDNHVTRRHHINQALYGDIRYTEPLLNNLHLLAPTLFYFDASAPGGARKNKGEADLIHRRRRSAHRFVPTEAIELLAAARSASQPAPQGAGGIRYLARFYYPALETESRLEQALDFVRRSGVDGVLLFEASYDMDPALLTLETLRERFARLKAITPRFRQLVNEVHINVMITLGHVDAGCGRPERFPFQFQVDASGKVSRSSACPLDPTFLERAAEQYRLAAECGADVVWVDDDTRFLYHDLSEMTCFCPLHLRAMQERTGRNWRREALVAALSDGTDPALRQTWFDLQENAILHLAQVIERTVHEVDPKIAIGLMSVGTAVHAAEGRRTDRLLRALAGGNRPLIRPGAGFWNDWQPGVVLDKTEGCARELSFLGEDVRAVAEVENHPYTPFGKSERVLALELALNVLAGMPDLSLNLLNSMGGSGALEPAGTDYAAFLRRQRPFLDALAVARAGLQRQGIGIADSEDYARQAPLCGKSLMSWVQPRPWETTLARLGFPLGRPDQAPHWIAGKTIHAFSDYDLAWYLRQGSVLDPAAAAGLLERGWGERLGLLSARPLNDAVNELFSADPLNADLAGRILPAYNHIPPNCLYTFELAADRGRALSRWINVDGRDMGCALTLLECPDRLYSAELTWRVALLPYAIQSPAAVLLNLEHRLQWNAVLSWLGSKPLPCQITKGVNLYPLVFTAPQNGRWLLAVANLSADDAAGEAALPLLAAQGKVEHLGDDGQWGEETRLLDGRLQICVAAFSVGVWRSF